jgi:hypothetical protein
MKCSCQQNNFCIRNVKPDLFIQPKPVLPCPITGVFPPPGSADEANYPGLYRGPVDPRDVDFRRRGRGFRTAPAATGVFYPEDTRELLDELKTRLERTVLDANMTKSLRSVCLTALMEVEDADNPYLQRALSEGEN